MSILLHARAEKILPDHTLRDGSQIEPHALRIEPRPNLILHPRLFLVATYGDGVTVAGFEIDCKEQIAPGTIERFPINSKLFSPEFNIGRDDNGKYDVIRPSSNIIVKLGNRSASVMSADIGILCDVVEEISK